MKNKALNTALVTLQLVTACIGLVALYLVYLPLALVRVFVDGDGYLGFLAAVGTCVRTMRGWFKKGGEK